MPAIRSGGDDVVIESQIVERLPMQILIRFLASTNAPMQILIRCLASTILVKSPNEPPMPCVFARAACRRSVLATWTLIHPPGTHPDPQDPRQPQTLSTLRKPCQISKRTFDVMACSPAQRVVALSLPLEPRFETMPRANTGNAVTSI